MKSWSTETIRNHPFTIKLVCLVFFGLFLAGTEETAAQNKLQFELSQKAEAPQTTAKWYFIPQPDTNKPDFIAFQSGQVWLRSDGTNREFQLRDSYLQTVFSKGGRYFGISRKQALPGSEHSNLVFDVFSADGTLQYALTRLHLQDDAFPVFSISDQDGSTIVGQNTDAKLEFYGRSGRLEKQVELFKHSDYNLERVLLMDRSLTGDLAVIATNRPAMDAVDIQDNATWLFLFDKDGHQSWQRALTGLPSVLAITPDGSIILPATYSTDTNDKLSRNSLFYDNDGNRFTEFDFLAKRVTFSWNLRFAILSDNREALIIDLASPEVTGRYRVSDTQEIIAAAAVADNGAVTTILTALLSFEDNRFLYRMPRLQILNQMGKVTQKLDFFDRKFEAPALSLSPDGNALVIGFEQAFEVYEIKP